MGITRQHLAKELLPKVQARPLRKKVHTPRVAGVRQTACFPTQRAILWQAETGHMQKGLTLTHPGQSPIRRGIVQRHLVRVRTRKERVLPHPVLTRTPRGMEARQLVTVLMLRARIRAQPHLMLMPRDTITLRRQGRLLMQRVAGHLPQVTSLTRVVQERLQMATR